MLILSGFSNEDIKMKKTYLALACLVSCLTFGSVNGGVVGGGSLEVPDDLKGFKHAIKMKSPDGPYRKHHLDGTQAGFGFRCCLGPFYVDDVRLELTAFAPRGEWLGISIAWGWGSDNRNIFMTPGCGPTANIAIGYRNYVYSGDPSKGEIVDEAADGFPEPYYFATGGESLPDKCLDLLSKPSHWPGVWEDDEGRPYIGAWAAMPERHTYAPTNSGGFSKLKGLAAHPGYMFNEWFVRVINLNPNLDSWYNDDWLDEYWPYDDWRGPVQSSEVYLYLYSNTSVFKYLVPRFDAPATYSGTFYVGVSFWPSRYEGDDPIEVTEEAARPVEHLTISDFTVTFGTIVGLEGGEGDSEYTLEIVPHATFQDVVIKLRAYAVRDVNAITSWPTGQEVLSETASVTVTRY